MDSGDEILAAGVEAGLIPGAVCVVIRGGEAAGRGALGLRARDPEEKMTADTIFDLASLTKPLATATGAMLLRDEGKLSLEDKVGDWLKARSPGLAAISVRQLLNHTSGLPAYATIYREVSSREELMERLLALELEAEAGSRAEYSCLGYLLLGLIVEQSSGSRLEEFARRRLFAPLGMRDTGFRPACHLAGGPAEEKRERIAPTGRCEWREKELRGEVHDPLAAAMGGAAGNAGLFGTAADLGRFASAWLRGELLPGETTREMTEETTGELKARTGLGWWLKGNGRLPVGEGWSERSFGHTGFTGTSLAIDPEQELVAILLTNRTYLGGEGDEFRRLRRRWHARLCARPGAGQ
jgi:CubicO group peptidase (beta-lactamase class C family)